MQDLGYGVRPCSGDAGNEVTIWGRRELLCDAIYSGHENPDYLPGIASGSDHRNPDPAEALTAPRSSYSRFQSAVAVQLEGLGGVLPYAGPL